MKITNTREFSESLTGKNPTTMQFPNNTNVILTERDVDTDWLGQVEEMARFSGRLVHLC